MIGKSNDVLVAPFTADLTDNIPDVASELNSASIELVLSPLIMLKPVPLYSHV